MGYWSDYELQAKATRKLGYGSGVWNIDEGCTVHAVRHGVTACGVSVGRASQGWLTGTWMRHETVSCKRCQRVLETAAKE